MALERTDVLIVGGGPAGIQASRLVRTLAPDKRVIVLRPEEYSVIYCAIPYAIEGLVKMPSIAKKDELITEVGAELWRDKALAADINKQTVTVDGGRNIHYKKLLIATGAIPFVPPVPGWDLDHILTVKTAEDTQRITQLASQARHAIVIGAGAIGIEQAQALIKLGLQVDLVDMVGHPLPSMIDGEYGMLVIKWLKEIGVRWYGNSAITKFEGNKAVSAVVLENGDRIKLEEGRDIIIVCAGVRPELGAFEQTDLKRGKDGLIVNSMMQTSHNDVYAAGDCVQYFSAIDGLPVGGKLATNAVPMAKVAAKNMIGINAQYSGFINGAATCVGDWRIGGTGFTEEFARNRGYKTVIGWGETTSRFPMMPGAQKVQVKIVADASNCRVLGGQVIGKEAVAERVDVITLALQQKLTVDDLAALSYSAQPWQTFFPARNAIVQAAEDAQKNFKKGNISL